MGGLSDDEAATANRDHAGRSHSCVCRARDLDAGLYHALDPVASAINHDSDTASYDEWHDERHQERCDQESFGQTD